MKNTNKLTAKQLLDHVRKWYPKYLSSMMVDIVEIDESVGGAVFGYPTGSGNSGFVRFIPLDNFQVGVQEGSYFDHSESTSWYEIETYPDVDYYFQIELDEDPEQKPARLLTNYRKY